MGVFHFRYEHVSVYPISPARLFNSFILDSHNLFPRVAPGTFESFHFLEGNGGPGTIKLLTYREGSPFKYAKHRVDEIDEVNYIYKYTEIEGDALGHELHRISHVVKLHHRSDGHTVSRYTSSYHTKTEYHIITEERNREGKQLSRALFHAAEAHLHAHPHEYYY